MHVPSLYTTCSIIEEAVNDLLKEHEIPVEISIKRLLGEPEVSILLWEYNQGTHGKITYYTMKRVPEEEFFIDLPCKECGK